MCGRTAHSAQSATDTQIPRIPIPPTGSNPARRLDYARLRARSSKLDARSKAYSTPARARPTSPLRPGPALLPLRRRLIQLAASSTKAACRRFVPRSHLLKWCRARRGQRRCGDGGEDVDVRHGIQDHIDIDAERCRGFGEGREDARRRAQEYSVLAIDTHSPLSWILRQRGGQGGPHSAPAPPSTCTATEA
ncbi:hypothetical protein B0H13DRAFT_2676491, partial [Mycena leptocephala]